MGEFQKYVGVEKPTLPPVLPKKFTFQKSLRGKHDHEKFAFIKVYLYIKKKCCQSLYFLGLINHFKDSGFPLFLDYSIKH